MNVLDKCDQVVIYGANGWMGRSAIDYISTVLPGHATETLLLIGSKPSLLEINGKYFNVLDPVQGYSRICEGAIFFNAAFLRREKLQSTPSIDYLQQNEIIASLAKNALKNKKLKSFINLSSGAARETEILPSLRTPDEYSTIKKYLEVEYSHLCAEYSTAFVNCRIFSLSGKYINEFDNLALSSFIKQATLNNRIEVKSPNTKRTYIDGADLSETLLTLANDSRSVFLDSGGSLVTLLELAHCVSRIMNNGNCEVTTQNENSPSYFGNYQEFNEIALRAGQTLLSVEEQIVKTITAFT